MPLVNVVLALPWGQGRPADREAFLFVNQAFGPVANGLLLAGYELRTTYDTPLTDADAYVVLAIGQGAEAQADLPQAIAALLEGDKPVVLVVDGLTSNGAWGESLPLLGVSAAWTPALSTARIDNATFDGSPVAWHGFPIWNSLPLTAVIREADVVGEALVSGEIEGQPAALVVKQGNKYLVNANLLHLQSSFICNQLLAPTLHEPFAGYGIVGQRSAFLALADTPLTVELPFDAGTEVRVIRYGADGAPQSADTVAYSEPLATSLNQHELLIVEPTSR